MNTRTGLTVVAIVGAFVLAVIGSQLADPADVGPVPGNSAGGESGAADPGARPKIAGVTTARFEEKEKEKSGLPPFPHQSMPGTAVRGKIVNSAGEAVAEARVFLQIGRRGKATLVTGPRKYERYASWRSPAIRTGEGGLFEIANLDPRGNHHLFVEPPAGLLGTIVPVGRPPTGQMKDLGDVVVYRPATVSGTVRDPGGATAPGVMVRIGRSITVGRGFRPSRNPMVQRVDRILFDKLVEGPGLSWTDDQGRFEIGDVPPGTYMVSCRADGYRDAEVKDVEVPEGGAAGPVDLTLASAYGLVVSIDGHDGAPLAGAQVTVGERDGRDYIVQWEDTTDATGQFRLHVRTADIEVVASADGHVNARRRTKLVIGEEGQVKLILQPGGAMKGRIVSKDTGKAPEDMGKSRLFLSRSVVGRGSSGPVGIGIGVDDEGWFTDRGLAPGPYSLTVRGAGYRPLELEPRVLEAGKVLDWGTIELVRGTRVDVTVVDKDGRPVVGARITKQYGLSLRIVTDHRGQATFYVGTVGELRLQARHQDAGERHAAPLTIAEDTQQISVTIELLPTGVVTGRLFDPDGKLLPHTRTGLLSADINLAWTEDTDDQGRFRFDSLPTGRYKMNNVPVFTVGPGETVVRDRHQRPKLRVRGLVLDAQGAPAAGCRIDLVPRRGPDGGWATPRGPARIRTDAEGRFVIEERHPSTIRVVTPEGRQVVFGIAGRPNEFTLRLPPDDTDAADCKLLGQVSDATTGRPIAGARVALEIPNPESGVGVLKRSRTVSGSDGRYELSLAAGSYVARTTRAGNATEERTVDFTRGQTRKLDISMHATGSLLFNVKLADGGRVSGGRLVVEGRIKDDPTSKRILRRYSAGSFAFNNLRLGATYAITITAPDRVPYEANHDVRSGKPERILVELR